MTNPQTLSLSNPPDRGVPIHRDCSQGGLPDSQIWSASKMSNFDLPPDTPGPEPASLNLTVKPHPGQLTLLQATQPNVAAIPGTGGGKTVAGMLWLVMQMARYPGASSWNSSLPFGGRVRVPP